MVKKLVLLALLLTSVSVLADGGPLFLCPPGSKTCRCTVTSCK